MTHLLEIIGTSSSSSMEELQTITKNIRDHIFDVYGKFHGNCEEAAGDLTIALSKHEWSGSLIYGTHPLNKNLPHWSPELGNIIGHFWVNIDDFILDPTIEQFYSKPTPMIFPQNSSIGKYYNPIEIIENF